MALYIHPRLSSQVIQYGECSISSKDSWKSLSQCILNVKQETVSPKKNFHRKLSPQNHPNIFKKSYPKSQLKRPQIPVQVSPALGTLANLIYSADCEATFGLSGDQSVQLISRTMSTISTRPFGKFLTYAREYDVLL